MQKKKAEKSATTFQTNNRANNSPAIRIDGMSFWMSVLYLVCHVTNQVRFKKQKKKKKQSNK